MFIKMMDLLCSDLVKLLAEHYFSIKDSLALFCTSKKFLFYGQSYHQCLLDAGKGIYYCITEKKLDACKFLYVRNQFDLNGNNDYWFHWSYLHNYLDMAQWLFQISDEINIHTCYTNFRRICEQGRLDATYWLVQLCLKINSPIGIDAYHDVFCVVCYHGQLDIALWLIQLGVETNSPINIHIDHDFVFRESCSQGYWDIAKWLFQLSIETNSPIDIHTWDDYAFRYSYESGRLNIAHWLTRI